MSKEFEGANENPTMAILQIAQDVAEMSGSETDAPDNPTDAILQIAKDVRALAEGGGGGEGEYTITFDGDIIDAGTGEPYDDFKIIKPEKVKSGGYAIVCVVCDSPDGVLIAGAEVTNADWAIMSHHVDDALPDKGTLTILFYNITGNVTFTWYAA